jgi:hypothetical protein
MSPEHVKKCQKLQQIIFYVNYNETQNFIIINKRTGLYLKRSLRQMIYQIVELGNSTQTYKESRNISTRIEQFHFPRA